MATLTAMDTSIHLSCPPPAGALSLSGKPILLLNLEVDKQKNERLVITPEGAAAMASLPSPVHVHLHVGPTRIGKSTLCNLQLRNSLSPSVAATFTKKFETSGGYLSHTKVLNLSLCGD